MFGNNAKIEEINSDSLSDKLYSLELNGQTQVLEFMLDLMTLTMPSLHFSIKLLKLIMDINHQINIFHQWIIIY
jgi:hypothetical protein